MHINQHCTVFLTAEKKKRICKLYDAMEQEEQDLQAPQQQLQAQTQAPRALVNALAQPLPTSLQHLEEISVDNLVPLVDAQVRGLDCVCRSKLTRLQLLSAP